MNITTSTVQYIIGGPSDFAVGWIIILVSALITALTSIAIFLRWLIIKFSKKSQLLKTLSLLAVGTNTKYFEKLLGTPVFINKADKYNECIFVNEYFFVQTLVNSEDEIVLFSVTTRKRNFNPKFKISDGYFKYLHIGHFQLKYIRVNPKWVVLGKTTFSKLLGEPKKILSRGGDHGAPLDFYSEIYYFGMDGHYLDYGFSINETGFPTFDYRLIPKSYYEIAPEDQEETRKFRSGSAINTYTVIGSIKDDEIGVEFGPRHSQIRILPE